MGAQAAAMREDLGVVAAGILQRIRENWQVLEASLGIDNFGDLRDGGCQPAWLRSNGPKGIAENVADQRRLDRLLGSDNGRALNEPPRFSAASAAGFLTQPRS